MDSDSDVNDSDLDSDSDTWDSGLGSKLPESSSRVHCFFDRNVLPRSEFILVLSLTNDDFSHTASAYSNTINFALETETSQYDYQ